MVIIGICSNEQNLISKTFLIFKSKFTTMKKFFLQAILLLTSVAVFAQDGDGEEHSAAYNFGEKYAIPIVIGVIVLIVVIIWAIRRKKNPPPPPPAPPKQ